MSCMAHAWAMGWQVTPSINTSETWSDNVGLSSSGGGSSSDFITEVTPAISFSGQSARAKAHFFGQLQNFLYADNSQNDRTSIRFQGDGEIELIEKHLFVDAVASSSQERVSLLGVNANDQNISNNRSTVQTFGISPFVPFRLGDKGNGMLRYSVDTIDSDSNALNNATTQTLSLNLQNGSAFGRLGWAFDANTSQSNYANANDVKTQMARASLLYSITPQLVARVSGGHEENDFAEAGNSGGATYGIGFNWNPSPRTAVSAFTEKRFFGTGYNYAIRHSRGRSFFTLSFSKDVTTNRQSQDMFGLQESKAYGRAFATEVLRLLAEAPKTGLTPEEEEALGKKILEDADRNVQKTGLSPYEKFAVKVFSNIYVLQRRLNLSATVTGVRNSVTLDLLNSTQKNIDSLNTSTGGDFSVFDETRENTARLSWTSRLTPMTDLNTALSVSRTQGEGATAATQSLRQTQLSVGSSTSLGPKTSGGLSYRHLRTRGTSDVNENAVTATLSHRF